eukprot:TRINITY_DN1572_c0_g1_i1.p1 TRINITY_DN1572_c0_g1~~TRINITY_DN1572_c0_g1_i1.p1  ORF type:complete len:400 (+),score=40.09 TRINITY_DN1572_c0_g1_i1:335-1534(+)
MKQEGLLLLFLVVVVTGTPVLQQVQIVTRHGARTPYSSIPNQEATWLCNLNPLSIPEFGVSDSILFSGRLYRTQYISGREFLKGNCSQGQLTTKGAMEHFKLGTKFREQYVTSQHLLSPEYKASEIYLRSTDITRTIQSAESQILGLYPPTQSIQAQIIPINIITPSEEDLLPAQRCPKMIELCNAEEQSSEWQQHLAKINSTVGAALRKAWGTNDIPWFVGIYNNLVAREFHDMEWPAGVTQAEMTQIYDFVSWQLRQMWSSEERVALGIGPFIENLVNVMDSRMKGETDPKFLLYSAHDTTISLVLAAFQLFNTTMWPPYASHIQFELYQDSSDSSWSVGILYNDEKVNLAPCPNTWMCPFDKFKSVASRVFVNDYDKQCNMGTPVKPEGDWAAFIC